VPRLLSREAIEIRKFLETQKIQHLYHFTDVRNLARISEQGAILSKKSQEDLGIWPCEIPGGDSTSHTLDRRNNNWDKVSLQLTPYTPMAYRKKQSHHLCFIVVKPQVAEWRGVFFTDMNANKNGHTRLEGMAGLNIIDFMMVRSAPQPGNPAWKDKSQAEVLVPDNISAEYIDHIAFMSTASLEEGQRRWSSKEKPEFRVNPTLLSLHPRSPTPEYSYVEEFYLFAGDADENSVLLKQKTQTTFSKDNLSQISCAAHLQASAGDKAQIVWKKTSSETLKHSEIEFETRDFYYIGGTINVSGFLVGGYLVEFYLRGIKWTQIEFEVLPF
jgi:hypothetical protein